MLIKKLKDLPEFLGGDHTLIKEVLKPSRDGVDAPYSVAFARLEVGTKSLKHTLKGSEVYFITQGKGLMHIDEEAKEVTEGELVFIPGDAVQFIENIGSETLEFWCIVSPPWTQKDENILE